MIPNDHPTAIPGTIDATEKTPAATGAIPKADASPRPGAALPFGMSEDVERESLGAKLERAQRREMHPAAYRRTICAFANLPLSFYLQNEGDSDELIGKFSRRLTEPEGEIRVSQAAWCILQQIYEVYSLTVEAQQETGKASELLAEANELAHALHRPLAYFCEQAVKKLGSEYILSTADRYSSKIPGVRNHVFSISEYNRISNMMEGSEQDISTLYDFALIPYAAFAQACLSLVVDADRPRLINVMASLEQHAADFGDYPIGANLSYLESELSFQECECADTSTFVERYLSEREPFFSEEETLLTHVHAYCIPLAYPLSLLWNNRRLDRWQDPAPGRPGDAPIRFGVLDQRIAAARAAQSTSRPR